jgi:hypothetical protein
VKTFTDARDRTWVINVDAYAIKRVKALTGIHLLSLINDQYSGLGAFLGDPLQLVDVLYVLARDPAGKPPDNDEDFGRALYGDAIHRAKEAFQEEFSDFFSTPEIRAALKKLFQKATEIERLIAETQSTQLDRMTLETMAESTNGESTNSPALSESTPAPSNSEN